MFAVGDNVKLKHTGETGVVVMIDYQHEQVELEFEDKSCAVHSFDQIDKVEK